MIMPHSVSSEAMADDGMTLPDAPEESAARSDDQMDTSNDATTASNNGADVKLDDLFQSDDEDDEFASSPPVRDGVDGGETSSPPLMPM